MKAMSTVLFNRSQRVTRMGVVGLVCGLLVLGLGIVGCGKSPEDPPGTPQTVKIAISSPLQRDSGIAIRQGAELAMERLANRAGPHRVELVFLDSDLSKEVPIEARVATEAVADPYVVAYVGPLHSTLARFSIPILNEAGLVQLSVSATWPGFTRPGYAVGEPDRFYPTGRRHFFRLIPADHLQGDAVAKWAVRQGFNNVAVVDNGLSHGRGVADIFASAAKANGIEVLGRLDFDLAEPVGGRSWMNVAEATLKLESELLFFGGAAMTGGREFLCRIRGERPELVILGTEGLIPGEFAAACDLNLLDGLLASQPMPIDHLGSTSAEELRAAWEMKYTESAPPLAVTTYEAIGVLARAIGSCLEPTRACVLEAVATQGEYSGVLGRWRFDSYGDRTPTSIGLMRFDRGRWVFVQELD